jgi:redox-sensing transcriptional repressor
MNHSVEFAMKKQSPDAISDRTIERLSLYRRLLQKLAQGASPFIHSHILASLAHSTSAQVRRDLMHIGFSGSPAHGYNVQDLMTHIDNVLDSPGGQQVALVGVGNLGRALLAYIGGQSSKLNIVAAFDRDPDKTDRLIHGIPCHSIMNMEPLIRSQRITIAIVTVPQEAVQSVVDLLVVSGIRAILNFVPVPVRVPGHVCVEGIDMMMSLEKLAYFARDDKHNK